jgi:lactate dehydrogenase-like 2-hydroxyacid dehydrogenase
VKPRVLVTREIPDEAVRRLKEHFTVESNQKDSPVSPNQLLQKLKGKDGVVTLSTDVISDAVLAKNPQLKIVSNVAVGYNNLDIAAGTRRGVMMTNTPGVLDDTTADLTWALILAAARGLANADRFVRSGKWKRWRMMEYLGQDVYGKTIGICGFGRIGRRVARRAMGFEMKVLYASRSRAPESVEQEFRASYVDKRTLPGDAPLYRRGGTLVDEEDRGSRQRVARPGRR